MFTERKLLESSSEGKAEEKNGRILTVPIYCSLWKNFLFCSLLTKGLAVCR